MLSVIAHFASGAVGFIAGYCLWRAANADHLPGVVGWLVAAAVWGAGLAAMFVFLRG